MDLFTGQIIIPNLFASEYTQPRNIQKIWMVCKIKYY
jgi:hypothetical protein